MEPAQMTVAKRGTVNSSNSGALLQQQQEEGKNSSRQHVGGGDDDDDNDMGNDMDKHDERKPMLTVPMGGTSAFHTTTTTTNAAAAAASSGGAVSRTGFFVLILLAVQNCSKTLLMRYVMKDQPKILTSAAVLGSEFLKCSASLVYILLVQGQSWRSVWTYVWSVDVRNTMLLAVPAAAYNLQMSLEYVALGKIDAATFSVLVQTKLVFTATMAALVLGTKLRTVQIVSLILLTLGVMLCNVSNLHKTDASENGQSGNWDANVVTGILATLGIAMSSGFASVYTEKVIKGGVANNAAAAAAKAKEYGLAYTQVQLAIMSLLTMGVYAAGKDFHRIVYDGGLFQNFTMAAFGSIFNSALGGLIVAAVLKYADSVLKGYATAVSVVLTGILSMLLFGTPLSPLYFVGIFLVVTAVLLYNGKYNVLDQYEYYLCWTRKKNDTPEIE